MSIHGILAVLLGSTALGGYAPLTLLRAQRFILTGVSYGGIAPITTNLLSVRGLDPKFMGTEIRQLAMTGYWDFAAYSITQNIILGFAGMMPTVLDLHTLFGDDSISGYGARYGASYGD